MHRQQKFINKPKVHKGSSKTGASEKPDIFSIFLFDLFHLFFNICPDQYSSFFYRSKCGGKNIFFEFWKTSRDLSDRLCHFISLTAHEQGIQSFKEIAHTI